LEGFRQLKRHGPRGPRRRPQEAAILAASSFRALEHKVFLVTGERAQSTGEAPENTRGVLLYVGGLGCGNNAELVHEVQPTVARCSVALLHAQGPSK